MTCPSCQQPVEDSALFCGNCGFHVRQEPTPVPVAEPAGPVAAVNTPAAAPTPNSSAISTVSQQALPPQPGQPKLSAYAVLQPQPAQSHTLELVLAILSIPASLFPLLGFGLGIPALVLARKHKAVVPTVLSIVGIGLSVVVVIFNILYYANHSEKQSDSSSTTVLIAPLRK